MFFFIPLEPPALTIEAMDTETLRSVNVAWSSLPSLVDPEPNQTYTLSVKSPSIEQTLLELDEPFYLFTADGAPPCEVYNFSVSATYVGANYTGDGCASHSPVLSTMLPSLPEVEMMESSINYILNQKSGKVILSVSYKVYTE